jgi:hypothetical protein
MKGEPLFTHTDEKIDCYLENDSPHFLMPVNDFGITGSLILSLPSAEQFTLVPGIIRI